MEIIIYKNLDGSCGILAPATDELTIEQIAEKDVPAGLVYRIAEDSILPLDNNGCALFREAWTDDNSRNTVDVDMDKAYIIHMNNIRSARNQEFINMGFPIKLDSDLEKNIIPLETRNKLQALRDIPQNIDLSTAKTPEELKAIWPKELA